MPVEPLKYLKIQNYENATSSKVNPPDNLQICNTGGDITSENYNQPCMSQIDPDPTHRHAGAYVVSLL